MPRAGGVRPLLQPGNAQTSAAKRRRLSLTSWRVSTLRSAAMRRSNPLSPTSTIVCWRMTSQVHQVRGITTHHFTLVAVHLADSLASARRTRRHCRTDPRGDLPLRDDIATGSPV
jgi:hypothetical protein